MQLSKYYFVNDRPVKLIPTADGGMDVLALNVQTGEFERDMGYLSKIHEAFADVDEVSEEEFEKRVRYITNALSSKSKGRE